MAGPPQTTRQESVGWSGIAFYHPSDAVGVHGKSAQPRLHPKTSKDLWLAVFRITSSFTDFRLPIIALPPPAHCSPEDFGQNKGDVIAATVGQRELQQGVADTLQTPLRRFFSVVL